MKISTLTTPCTLSLWVIGIIPISIDIGVHGAASSTVKAVTIRCCSSWGIRLGHCFISYKMKITEKSIRNLIIPRVPLTLSEELKWKVKVLYFVQCETIPTTSFVFRLNICLRAAVTSQVQSSSCRCCRGEKSQYVGKLPDGECCRYCTLLQQHGLPMTHHLSKLHELNHSHIQQRCRFII